MKFADIPYARLFNLQLSRTTLTTPAEMVAHMGAMQAQDFAAAKWALGLRLRPASDAAIEKAFNDGAILRTHVLRPTWHFVTPEDIRWLLALTGPRVQAGNAGMVRRMGMDSAALARTNDILAKALTGGGQLSRDELRDVVQRAGIHVESGLQMSLIVMNAELEGIICSGPRRGKQFTYMLLDERAPNARSPARDEALAELVRRYFRSHGPATAGDFARWSGLTLADTRNGLAAVRDEFYREEIEGQTYWFIGDTPHPQEPSPTAYLLSIFDEYTIGYKDRSAIGEREHGERLQAMGNALQNVIILDGQIVGTWRREVGKEVVIIELSLFNPRKNAENHAIAAAGALYGKFLGLKAEGLMK